jgi:small-conductance mechanosensitive channel
MKYLEIAGVAFALFFLMRLMHRYIPVLFGKWSIKLQLIRILYLTELVGWSFFILWAPVRLFKESDILFVIEAFMAVMLIGLIGWYLLRDFVSGAILQIENPIEKGSYIITPYAEGVVSKLRFRSAEIITPKGESVRLPYSLIVTGCITKPPDNPKRVEQIIHIGFRSDKPVEELRESVKRALYTMPWVIAEDQIKIDISYDIQNGQNIIEKKRTAKSTDTKSGYYNAEIHFHTTSSLMAIKTKEELMQIFCSK